VLLRDVADQLLDEDGLAQAGAAEEANLAALDEGRDQVDDLDARDEDLDSGLELVEIRRRTMDRPALLRLRILALVDRVAEHVEDAAERRRPDGHGDGRARILDVHAAGETVRGVHGDRAHAIVAEVLLHLGDEVEGAAAVLFGDRNAQRVEDLRQLLVEHGVDDDALDLDDLADVVFPVLISHRSPGRFPGSVYPRL
jgi:hypothetical protein